MNIHLKNKPASNPQRAAFTLIEMIGVLAVIAILAAVLIPKVFQAINDSRVNNAAMSCQTVKTAIADHYAKYGSLTSGRTTPPVTFALPTAHYDTNLLFESFLDKPFAVKIGDGTANTLIELDSAEAGTQAAVAPATFTPLTHITGASAFNLDGVLPANDALGTAVVYAVITGVNLSDARDLNTRIDGAAPELGETVATAGAESDIGGRVKYTFVAGAPTTVYIYLTHR